LGTNEARKLFYMLGQIIKAHEVIVLENRLIRLESNMKKMNNLKNRILRLEAKTPKATRAGAQMDWSFHVTTESVSGCQSS